MIRIAIIWLLVLWAIGILYTIALLLACALRVTRRRVRPYGLRAEAGDPFLSPFGEMPIVPRERITPLFHHEPVSAPFGRAVRMRDDGDFRAWGIPEIQHSAAVAHQRNESGGRPASLSGTAVVLTFPGRKA